MLKLSEDETAVLAAQRGREGGLERLSDIPELLLTLGFRCAEIRVGGAVTCVAPDRVIEGVQTTGAGDVFMIAYLIGRDRGLTPTAAATLGANVGAEMLPSARRAMTTTIGVFHAGEGEHPPMSGVGRAEIVEAG